MKLLDKKKIEWKKINEVILMVNSIDLDFQKNLQISLDCSFENISKGRCKMKISENKNKNKNSLFVYTDKPLMEVEIFHSNSYLRKLLDFFALNKNNNKKVKVSLNISDSLMVSNSGYLFVKDNLQISVDSVSWSIPII
tara:strand:+ start:3036 stop:3452 length:417 start_codon:yes stop_codon:yes gene_type:complete